MELIDRRLAGVTIEQLNLSDFVLRYDRPNVLFYLDPPYWNVEDYYGKDLFKWEDYQVIATILAQLKGKFLLFLNDVPEIRKTFSQFHIKEVTISYTFGSSNNTVAKGLIITNCDF
ncbi:DNA adenine methylase [Bartonella sp. CB74]|uniref:DNA adenine methylase n=1 Tax=Bartonella sp. CB74 TaxID=3113620 RepID=UPI002F96D572